MSRLMDMDEPPGSAAMMEAEQGLEGGLEARSEHSPSTFMMEFETFQNLLLPLLSCGVCGNILEDPVTLQCGNTLCRACLPGSVVIGNRETMDDGSGAVPPRST